MIETPRWHLTLFKVHFGLLTLKGYTKGEHVLGFEAIVHNTRALGCGRVLEKFPARLAGMADRFMSMLDCVDIGVLPDRILDELPIPPGWVPPGWAGSISTSPGSATLWPPLPLWRSPPTASPSPSSPPGCMR
ncbi:MAG: hypothetical protein ACRDIC_20825 [bacterium]